MRQVGLDDGFSLTTPGGIGRYTRALHAALSASDADRWVPVWVEKPRWLVRLPAPLRRVFYLLWAPRALRHVPADILHFTNYAVPPGLPVPAVATLHDLGVFRVPEAFPPLYRVVQRGVIRAACRRARVLLAPSHAVRREVCETLQVDPGRVLVGGNGSRLAWEAEPCPRVDPFPRGRVLRLLGVGCLERRKAWETLLEAAGRLRAAGRPCWVTLIGRPGYGFEALRARVAALPGPVPVELLLDAEDPTLARAYRTADLLVAPSCYEGFDLPVLEAMAVGLPVVASDLPVHRELLGDAGSFFRPRDAGDLAAAIEDLCQAPGRYEALTRVLPARARRFTKETLARAHTEAYDQAMRGRNDATPG